MPRMMMRRMPSSIREKAQSTCEPKAMGVNTSRRIKVHLMRKSVIGYSLLVNGYSLLVIWSLITEFALLIAKWNLQITDNE